MIVAALATLGSELIVALLLWAGLKIAGISPSEHLRWFGGCFVPPLLLLRYYAKSGTMAMSTKAAIVVLFVTFILFMFFVLK